MLASEIESVVNNEARAAGVLPKTYKEKDQPGRDGCLPEWDIALRARVRTATAGREATVRTSRAGGFPARREVQGWQRRRHGHHGHRRADCCGRVDGRTEPGRSTRSKANGSTNAVRWPSRRSSIAASRSSPSAKIDIATQAYQEAKRDNAASENAQAETVKRQENAHRALYSLFQTSLVMKGDRQQLAKKDALGMVTAETARALGDHAGRRAEHGRQLLWRPQVRVAEAWETKRAPMQNDGTFLRSGAGEAFQRWLFTGQERRPCWQNARGASE